MATLHVKAEVLPRYLRLLSRGVQVPISAGCSLIEFLGDTLELEEKYISERVQTIFLNGQVVDDLTTACLQDGDTLALSGAMPGLAGAVLRRGGFYAGFRSGISHCSTEDAGGAEEGWLKLKAFNLVAADIGPALLARGIRIPASALNTLIQSDPEYLHQGSIRIQVDAQPCEWSTLVRLSRQDIDFQLQITSL
jgi:hypothetical protein